MKEDDAIDDLFDRSDWPPRENHITEPFERDDDERCPTCRAPFDEPHEEGCPDAPEEDITDKANRIYDP